MHIAKFLCCTQGGQHGKRYARTSTRNQYHCRHIGYPGILGGLLLLAGGVPALGIISLILGVLYLVLAWGLWTLKPWAFWGTVILEALTLITGIFGLGTGRATNGILSLIFAVVVSTVAQML